MDQERVWSGQAVAPGIGLGPAFLLRRERKTVQRSEIADIELELARLDKAIERARAMLELHRKRAARRFGDVVARIFDTHLMILEDEPAFDEIRELIRTESVSAQFAAFKILDNYARHFEKQEDTYFRDRAQDVRDVCRRLVGQLDGEDDTVLSDIPDEPCVLLAAELNPTDILRLPQDQIIAVATDAGGATSHTAILTRTLGVPSVVGLRDITTSVQRGDIVVINGNSGKVVLHPNPDQLARYERKHREYKEFVKSLEDIRDQRAETTDGHSVLLNSNIEMPSEAAAVLRNGSDGVGLFRTEYLVLTHGGLPDEEMQYNAYRNVIIALEGRPITFRTFDLGGDKAFPGAGIPVENNPFLGWRAIRVGLDRPEMMKPQLRAIFRAAVHGPAKLMFPMISTLEELYRAKEVLQDVLAELEADGIEYSHEVPVGMMVEVPSSALLASRFAPHVDFFSIGTNDLVQFTMAVDRGNEQVAGLHQPFNPAVLNLIKMTVDAGRMAQIPVSMCGEMAGQPLGTLLLLGLGLDELSTSPSLVPEVKKLVISSTLAEARKLAEESLRLDTAPQVRAHLLEYMKSRFKNLPIWFEPGT
ncbi:phosphoenolpyruvate--protein phosphotransferase [bacterium]|nr:phosphoenolpyruvate--protein phosphotransferase [bacterium]